MKICIAGKNKIAVNFTDWLLKRKSDLEIYVVTNKSDSGKEGVQPSFKNYAKTKLIPEIELSQAENLDLDLFLSLEFDSIIKIKNFQSKCLFNVHFSLLPRYRGVCTSAWPILNGEKKTGVTLHEIDNGIDSGPVIDQLEIEIDGNETAESLYEKYQKNGIALIKKNFDNLLLKKYQKQSQNLANSSYYSKKSINYKELKINLDVDSETLSRQIRAYYFPEFQIPEIHGLKVKNPQITKIKSKSLPGSIEKINSQLVKIATQNFDVICEVINVDANLVYIPIE